MEQVIIVPKNINSLWLDLILEWYLNTLNDMIIMKSSDDDFEGRQVTMPIMNEIC
jgi:hypothetical protein